MLGHSYKLRIESMLLKEEFATNMGYLEPSINAMIVAGEGKAPKSKKKKKKAQTLSYVWFHVLQI